MSILKDPISIQLPITFNEIVTEIVQHTELLQTEVEQRVWMEALETGWNVRQDVRRFDVTPFQFNDRMIRLYTEGDSFIFDSLIFWSKPGRRLWIQHAWERIRIYADRTGIPFDELKILMYGDGPGNDSLFLVNCGLNLDYYEVPGSKTFDFAVKRFKHYGVWGRGVEPIYNDKVVMNGQYDVILSFEVLEHLPEPVKTIQEFNTALKTGGIAIITDDFGDLAPYLPTHLRSGSKYFGTAPFLFLKNGMVLSWYSEDELFKPYEFVKAERIYVKEWMRLMRDYNVRSLYLSKYIRRLARFIDKLPYFRFKHD